MLIEQPPGRFGPENVRAPIIDRKEGLEGETTSQLASRNTDNPAHSSYSALHIDAPKAPQIQWS